MTIPENSSCMVDARQYRCILETRSMKTKIRALRLLTSGFLLGSFGVLIFGGDVQSDVGTSFSTDTYKTGHTASACIPGQQQLDEIVYVSCGGIY